MTDSLCWAIPKCTLFRGNLTISNFALAPETLVTAEMAVCANSSVHWASWVGLRTILSLAAVYLKTCRAQGVCNGALQLFEHCRPNVKQSFHQSIYCHFYTIHLYQKPNIIKMP